MKLCKLIIREENYCGYFFESEVIFFVYFVEVYVFILDLMVVCGVEFWECGFFIFLKINDFLKIILEF